MADNTTDGASVKLGADTGAATSSFNDAAQSIASSLKGIQDSLAKFSQQNKQVLSDAVKNNADLSRSFLELRGSVTGGFNAIAGVVARFRGVLGTLTGALAGGALFKESVASMLDMEDAVRTLEITLGTTAQRATLLAVNLKLAGVAADSFAQMAFRVQMRLNTQGEEFDRLGVKIKDANGNFLPMEDILANIYKRMQDFKAGADQNGFALEMVGRNARDFSNEMSRLGAVQQRATQLMQQFGIEMGPERQAQIEGYRVEVNSFKVVLEAIGDQIGAVVLPNLMRLAEYFNSIGPQAIDGIVRAVKGLLTIFEVLKDVGITVFSVLAASISNLGAVVKGVALAMMAALSGQWSKIPGIVSATYNDMRHQTDAMVNQIVDTWRTGITNIGKLWSDVAQPPKVNVGLPKSGNERFTPKPQGGQDDSMMEGLENELKAEQDAYNKKMLLQGSFQTWSLEQTRDYWQNVLAQVELSVKDRMAAENRYYDAERALQIQAFQAHIATLKADEAAFGANIQAKIALAQQEYNDTLQRYGKENAATQEAYKHLLDLRKQLADQRSKIADEEEKRDELVAQHELSQQRSAADQAVAMRQMSSEQRYALEQQYLDREYALQQAAVQRRIDLLKQDPNYDPVKLQELLNQLLQIRQQYEDKVTQVVQKAEIERAQDAINAANSVQSAFSTALSSVATGTKSVSQAFKDMVNSISQSLAKIASDQIAKQLFGAGTTGGNFLNNIFGKIFGTGGSSNATGAAALTSAGTTLTTAGTTLTSSGSLLSSAAAALQAAAASLGAAGGLGGSFGGGNLFGGLSSGFGNAIDMSNFLPGGIPFFATGTNYVPRDTLAFIHKGEAVIPAALNKPGTSSSPAGGLYVQNIFTIGANVDQRSQGQVAAAAARGVAIAQRRNL